MGCPSCEQAARQRAQQQPHPAALARPRANYQPPIYRFRDAEEPPNTFESEDLTLLLARIVQHRFENKLPEIAYLKETVLNFTMLSDPAYQANIEYYTPDHQVHLSASQYLKGALAFAKASLVLTDAELFVAQEEAERRALICLNCPRNVSLVNGRGATSPNLAQSKFCQLAKDKTTSVDGALQICGVCTCVTRCKVHFSQKFIEESSTEQLLQQFKQEYVGRNGKQMTCWIAK